MKNLEKIISQNRDAFDDAEPSAGHFARFREKIESTERMRLSVLNRKIQRYAAAVVLVIAISGALLAGIYIKNSTSGAYSGISSELNETENYYQDQINQNIQIIKKLNIKGDGATKKSILNEISDMNNSIKQLKKDLVKYQYDERVEHAIITQYQMELELTDQIITQTKKWSS